MTSAPLSSANTKRPAAVCGRTRSFFSFDSGYLKCLESGDAATGEHFARYFGSLLEAKLRMRVRSKQLIENICQETLLRVLEAIRKKGGIQHPERLGAFVVSVCRFVTLEQLRSESKFIGQDENSPEPVDESDGPDAPVERAEVRQMVADVLEELPEKDRTILRLLFLQDVARPDVCRQLGVDDNYLRVALFRAKNRFRERWIWGAVAC